MQFNHALSVSVSSLNESVTFKHFSSFIPLKSGASKNTYSYFAIGDFSNLFLSFIINFRVRSFANVLIAI